MFSNNLIVQYGVVSNLSITVTLLISYSESFSALVTGNNTNYSLTYFVIIDNLTTVTITAKVIDGRVYNPGKASYLTIGY